MGKGGCGVGRTYVVRGGAVGDLGSCLPVCGEPRQSGSLLCRPMSDSGTLRIPQLVGLMGKVYEESPTVSLISLRHDGLVGVFCAVSCESAVVCSGVSGALGREAQNEHRLEVVLLVYPMGLSGRARQIAYIVRSMISVLIITCTRHIQRSHRRFCDLFFKFT